MGARLEEEFVRKIVGILSFVLLLSVSAAAQAQQPIRVKCGGAAYTDSKGQAWAADNGFNGGLVSKTTGTVSGTPDPALFQTGRTAPDSGSLVYTFPASNGPYHVNLYFAELNPDDFSTGARVFNVLMQNNPTFQNVDIFAAVGSHAALIKSADIAVSNGAVQLEFDTVAGADRAKITAIEVLPGAAAANAPILALNFVYPDGTPVTGTLNYTMTTSALKIGGSTPLVNGQATCTIFATPQMMGLIGNVQLNLSLVDNAGHTLWQVGMTMDSTNVNLGGVQSSALSVVVQKM
jgi:hypothetical protein